MPPTTYATQLPPGPPVGHHPHMLQEAHPTSDADDRNPYASQYNQPYVKQPQGKREAAFRVNYYQPMDPEYSTDDRYMPPPTAPMYSEPPYGDPSSHPPPTPSHSNVPTVLPPLQQVVGPDHGEMYQDSYGSIPTGPPIRGYDTYKKEPQYYDRAKPGHWPYSREEMRHGPWYPPNMPPRMDAPVMEAWDEGQDSVARTKQDCADLKFNVERVESKRERKHRDIADRMQRLDQEFMENRERLFIEKMHAIREEMRAVQEGTHPEFWERLMDIQQSQEDMIFSAQLFRDYQIERIETEYEQERAAAEDDYKAEKRGLRDKMIGDIEERRRRLKEEKDSHDLNIDVIADSNGRLNRNLRKRGMESTETKTNKRKQVQGPAFVMTLKEEDIIMDLAAIRKGYTSSKKARAAKR
ncbi:hypothetical protein BZG36_03808 [Bifiguratus adelaidae]|uniref:Uncharacterized protein n=1 Tax=Bifiguratus adelaidae TaxID=1938954 RepID=A0A261XX02_9FUNG|nr:hypothetical protein BZG36_03808 [Bifiguratus adelaidae]